MSIATQLASALTRSPAIPSWMPPTSLSIPRPKPGNIVVLAYSAARLSTLDPHAGWRLATATETRAEHRHVTDAMLRQTE